MVSRAGRTGHDAQASSLLVSEDGEMLASVLRRLPKGGWRIDSANFGTTRKDPASSITISKEVSDKAGFAVPD